MSVLLVGDAHDDYTDSTSPLESAIFQNGFSYVAAESGVVEELWLRTNAETNDCTSVLLGIFPDNGTGLAPTDTLLASVEVAGTPPPNTWIGGAVTGSASIVAGETYWLAARGRDGTLHFNCLADGGLGRARVNNVSPNFITWGTSFSELSSLAPIGFKALGEPTAAVLADRRTQIALTTHHDPATDTPAAVVRSLLQIIDFDVSIDQDGSREARVTLSTYYEPASILDSGRNDYLYRLFIRYGGKPAIWAPVKSEWDADAGTVTLIAKDTDRLENHYLRDGDDAIDNAPITADYQGIRLLRDAADNTADQDTRGVIPLGIKNGTDDLGTRASATAKFERWAQVWASMVQIALGAFNFELEPLDIATVDTYDYMALNTYAQQGTDRTSGPGAVILHCKYGLRNLTNHQAAPDLFYTHVHAHSDGGQARVTAYHAASSRARGIYVREQPVQYQDPDGTELAAAAKSYIKAYGLPTHAFTLTLRPEAAQQKVALGDYGIGDTILAGVKSGYYVREDTVRIVGIRISQTNRLREAIVELTVVNEVVIDADVDTTEPT